MKKILVAITLITSLCFSSIKGFAWGKTGHELTGTIAWHYLDDSTRKIVKDFWATLLLKKQPTGWMM